jgi:transcriptional regulator with XRE-family HTH domain
MLSRAIFTTRTRLGQSQADFAKHFGVNQSTVQRWENDKYEIPPRTVKLIEYVLYRLGIEFAERQRVK